MRTGHCPTCRYYSADIKRLIAHAIECDARRQKQRERQKIKARERRAKAKERKI